MTEEKFVEVPYQEVEAGDTIRATFKSGDVFKGKVQHAEPRRGGVEYEFEDVIFQSSWVEKIERLVPPFEPTWGMVIGDPRDNYHRVAYAPARPHDMAPWLGGLPGEENTHWHSHKDILDLMEKHGWVVLEKPEGVK